MKTLQTLLIGALVGALLAVLGLAALDRSLNKTAAGVAKQQASESGGYDPQAPPPFYGNR